MNKVYAAIAGILLMLAVTMTVPAQTSQAQTAQATPQAQTTPQAQATAAADSVRYCTAQDTRVNTCTVSEQRTYQQRSRYYSSRGYTPRRGR